ncbi:hypothetical protein [uncultured Chryseobacterium sp.]|uniref:hypothetical protein n=1 Tax=uncultured Chryseobacterium sp. TaxID=259322 RepID=UPI002584F04C|nr:hypothetical protein [uncultured Chryseobacterium sp.]
MDDEQFETIINRLNNIDDRLITLSDKLSDIIGAIDKVDKNFEIVSNIKRTLESIEEIVDARLK